MSPVIELIFLICLLALMGVLIAFFFPLFSRKRLPEEKDRKPLYECAFTFFNWNPYPFRISVYDDFLVVMKHGRYRRIDYRDIKEIEQKRYRGFAASYDGIALVYNKNGKERSVDLPMMRNWLLGVSLDNPDVKHVKELIESRIAH